MTIPFFDYRATFAPDRDLILRIVADVGASDSFILKDRVAEFERMIRETVGAEHAVAVASGTSALTLSLAAMGVKPGVDVLTPAFSFIVSASAIVHLGARPVFVDVDPETCTIDPEQAEAALTPRTRVVVPVHLFSCLADMAALRKLAARYDLCVLEDSAVALGARTEAGFAGTHGDVGVFSFFPLKPLGGIGDGGMIVTNDDALGTRCRMLRNHGQDGVYRFLHHHLGFNSRMDEIMAAYLGHRFQHMQRFIEQRAQRAAWYDEQLAGCAPRLTTPPTTPYHRVYYAYVVQAEDRDRLRAYLAERGIETQVYYPKPLPLQPAFAALGHRPGDFPVAEKLSRRTLALPFYPDMPRKHVERVCETIRDFYA